MLRQLLLFSAAVAAITLFGVSACYSAQGNKAEAVSEEVYHSQEGEAHFKKGFYDLIPRQKKEEAAQELGLAIQEFQQALAINPACSEAHKNLARLYYIQGKFLQSAMHYEKLTELNPDDIDSYVLAALAYAQAEKFAEARAQLESAKKIAVDEQISNKLNEYLKKLEQWEEEGAR